MSLQDDIAPLQMSLRSKQAFQTYQGSTEVIPTHSLPPVSTNVVYSDQGDLLAVPNEEFLDLFSVSEDHSLSLLFSWRCCAHTVQFSPRGSFLVVWQRPELTQEENEPNLCVFDLRDTTAPAETCIHARFFQKKPLFDSLYIHWTLDEFVAARLVSNEIQFFDGQDLRAGLVSKLHLDNVSRLSFAPVSRASAQPKKTYKFLSYSPGSAKKSQPSTVSMYRYPDFSLLNAKSSYTSDQIDLCWSCNGQVALAKGTVEQVQESYYGSSKLFFLTGKGDTLNVVREGSESIADAQWSPVAKEFIVIQGRVATLYEGRKCEALFEFGSSAWNVVRWSPQGTFVMLGGFGNMAGDMRFWHRSSLKEIGCASAQGSKVFEWAPDGVRFVTANLHPWRRVDNCLKVWKYTGELLQSFTYEELYQVSIRRCVGREFPAPELSEEEMERLVQSQQKRLQSVAQSKYVPPSLRKKGAASKFTLNSNKGPRVLKATTAGVSSGKESLSACGKKESSVSSGAVETSALNKTESRPTLNEKGQTKTHNSSSSSTKDSPRKKKIKALRKKLRQIAELKELAENGGELDEFGLQKISKEAEIQSHLSSLERSLD